MADTLEQLANQHNLGLCVECGKCVAVCPMGQIFSDFRYQVSPRGVIESTLVEDVRRKKSPAGPAPDSATTLTEDHLWFCLTCDLCTDLCPAGVRFRDFVEAARRRAIELGLVSHAQFCRHCGTYLWPQHTVEYLKEKLGTGSEDSMTLCPRCRQYDWGKKIKALSPGGRQVGDKGEKR